MKTYKFVCRSTRRGFKEWPASVRTALRSAGSTVMCGRRRSGQFRERVGAQLESEGYQMEEHQYTL